MILIQTIHLKSLISDNLQMHLSAVQSLILFLIGDGVDPHLILSSELFHGILPQKTVQIFSVIDCVIRIDCTLWISIHEIPIQVKSSSDTWTFKRLPSVSLKFLHV